MSLQEERTSGTAARNAVGWSSDLHRSEATRCHSPHNARGERVVLTRWIATTRWSRLAVQYTAGATAAALTIHARTAAEYAVTVRH